MSHSDISELQALSRRYMASYVLFNQAVADHLGMHPTDLQAMSVMTMEDGPFTAKSIAELTGLTSGSATRLVDRLEKGGWVRRQRDEEDRRRVLVIPVPEAVERLRAVWNDLNKGWKEMLADTTADERAALLRHMRRTIELSERQISRLREMG
ncbi:putative HTH-type transcriptional regulator YcgE [Actinorhabdospora filicis]|uniref:HTH-type transcriptional regulator YcgE n=1 Tax=Actinorhabdospora filicis TaxID=1785913 RepID=A0A9W6SKE2_9ACTN|nr:MarR family winged helix-turn-helix transcriptional regulator [Actinorhabdospora filicis]GLZ77274.1 putative HTH-type transcriptional regulator YcgE [Actinorhabdospora filicis]